jgi:hypothetical protein
MDGRYFPWMIDELCHTFFPSFRDPTYIIVKLLNLVDETTSHLSSSGPHILVQLPNKDSEPPQMVDIVFSMNNDSSQGYK